MSLNTQGGSGTSGSLPLNILGPKFGNNVLGPKTMEDVKELLEDAALGIYVEVFDRLGYDSLDHLLAMGPSELLDLKRLTKMKEGHYVRLQTTMDNWSVIATPSTASAPTTPRSVGPVEMGPMGPMAMGPAAAAMGPSLPTDLGPTDLGPSQSMVSMVATGPNPVKEALMKTYKTWKEAFIVSLNYSTQEGASAMQDRKKSGGRRKILGCRSVLSRKAQNNDGPKCPHYLLWTKNKLNHWKLNLEASTLEHMDFCTAGQLVRRAQLIHDPVFVKNQKLGKLSTGKEAATLALGYNGRMDGSVKDYTARRARNTIKHYDAFDYDDDWTKLNQWGRQFAEMNPGSMFDLQMDDEGRLVIGLMRMHWAHSQLGPTTCIGPNCEWAQCM